MMRIASPCFAPAPLRARRELRHHLDQLLLRDLAERREREIGHDLEPLRQLVLGDLLAREESHELVERRASCPARRMMQAHMRSPRSGSGTAMQATFCTAGCERIEVLDLLGADLLAAAVDEVLLAALDHVVARRMLPHQIARAVEAVGGEGLARCARARRNSRAACKARARTARRPRRTGRSLSSSSSSRTSSSGQIGRPTVSSRTSSGSSRRTNISMPSDMPKFSCTKALGISSLGARCRTSGCSRWPPLWM